MTASITEWAERIRSGDLRALARAATAVENRAPDAEALLKELFPYTGHASVYGITGPPGAGKSTFTDRLTHLLRREQKQVGILAVDPTSPYTGGAILGDRIRMQSHYADPGVFIRSLATRGWMGGLARAAGDLALLMDAAGRDAVLVETVGVGQDEVEVARLADVTVLVLVPNLGDDVQALKAGIMEIAGVFIINKSDHPGAGRLEREIKGMLSLAPHSNGWEPPIVKTVASEGQGMDEALAAIRNCERHGGKRSRAAETWVLRLRQMIRDRLMESISQTDLAKAAEDVTARRCDPYTVVESLIREQ